MKRDTLKTLAGLLIIGVIVVATFMYGNAQRQAQIKRDETAKKSQEAKANQSKTTLPSASAQAQGNSGQTNTAPVQSPGRSNVQGGAKATPTQSAAPTTAPKTGAVAGATAPSGTPLPQAGSPLTGMIGVLVVIASVVGLRRSKKNLLTAVRTHR